MRIVACPFCFKLYVYRKYLLAHLAMSHPLTHEPLDRLPSLWNRKRRRGRAHVAAAPNAPAPAPRAVARRVIQLLPRVPREVIRDGGQTVAWRAKDLPPKKRHLMQIRQEAPAPERVRKGSGSRARVGQRKAEVSKGGVPEVDPRAFVLKDQCGGCGKMFNGRKGVVTHRRHCKAVQNPPPPPPPPPPPSSSTSSSALVEKSGGEGAPRVRGFDLNQLPPPEMVGGKLVGMSWNN